MLRHPDLATTLAMADRVGSELHLYAEREKGEKGEKGDGAN